MSNPFVLFFKLLCVLSSSCLTLFARFCVMPFLCVPSDGWGLSVQAMQESSLC